MNFQEAESYLLSLGNEVETMKLGLENIRRLLNALGNPNDGYLKVQVAGTNGKGSVCAFLNSICVTAGIRTGMFTSPHLVSVTERVKIDGVDISEDEFARIATHVREVSERLVASADLENIPTFFEQVTAIALSAFAEATVELAILETGLGGRLDATTAANAEIAAITRIDLDHQKYLGDTIEEIAAEKAAIIHAGSRVVIGEQEPEVMELILERCALVGVEPHFAAGALVVEGGNPTRREGVGCQEGTPSLRVGFPPSSVTYPDSQYLDIRLGLPGRHQTENASIAVGIADVLREKFSILDEHVITGLKEARHPGRLELTGEFLFDGAHNIGGARALRAFLDEFVNQPITMIFGSMEDKNVGEIGSILFPAAKNLILTRPGNSRAMSPEALLESLPNGFDREQVILTDKVEDAVRQAQATRAGLIVVTGSLYLVGEVRLLLSNKLKTEK